MEQPYLKKLKIMNMENEYKQDVIEYKEKLDKERSKNT